MNILKKIFLVVLLSSIFIACEKEEPLSLVELELIEFVEINTLTKCSIRVFKNGHYLDEVRRSSFKFSNGFIIAKHFQRETEVGYNLNNLSSYHKVGTVLYLEFHR